MLEQSINSVRNQLEQVGTTRPNVLTKLSIQYKFIEAISSPLGLEILKDLSVMTDKLLDKIIAEEATVQEKAEFRVCKDILVRWGSRIKAYDKNREPRRK